MSLAALSVIALRGKSIAGVQPPTGIFLGGIFLIVVAAITVAATAAHIDDRQIAAQVAVFDSNSSYHEKCFRTCNLVRLLRCVDWVEST